MDIFSLTGKIAVEYSDAVRGLDRVSDAASDAADELNEVDGAARDAGESVNDAGDAARDADSGFTIWKGTISNLVSNAITSLISKCTELAGKIVDLTKTAVGNYADYEQLVGGVETLFGESADTIIGYADTAYKTAGLSANDYMETATSFAASLIQGLGSDTEAAVRLTDLAITDMSDNANKMGTDISSIQAAYQGFAKQNYTMLDNLKLGYGGTQSEMIRLINDSGILNEEISSLDGITFDQMIEAIHAVQDNLGITGTTAAEAGSTISGSWSSVKSLFQNILTKVGSELAPTVMGFLSQLSEWMENVDWDAFAEGVGEAFGSLFDWISTIDFTSFFQSAIEGVTSFIQGLGSLVSKVVSVIQAVQNFADLFNTLAPIIAGVTAAVLAYKAAMAISSLIQGVSAAMNGMTIAQYALNLAMSLNPIGIVIALIAGLVTAIVVLWNKNEGFRNLVIRVWEAIKTAFGTAINAIKGFFTGLVDKISEALSSAWNTITSAFNAVVEFFQGVWDTVSGVFNTVVEGFKNVWSRVVEIFNDIIDAVSSAWETVKNAVQVAIMLIGEILSAAFQIITLPFRFIWENCKEYVFAAWEWIKEKVSAALDAISNTITTIWNAIVSFLTPILEGIKNTFNNIWNAIKNTVTTVVNAIKTTITTVWNAIKSVITTVLNAIKTTVTNIWNNIKTTVTNTVNNVKNTVTNVFNAIKSTITSILNGIKSVFSSVWNSIKSTVTTVINGIKSGISSGLNAAKGTVTSVLNGIKSTFTNVFNGIKSFLNPVISWLKGIFNFSWSLPKIKLPHFSISGSFSLNPPSIPHFSVSWYKKAMEDGMIMNSPTIFGFDKKSNQFLGGGEAGSETVVGTDNLMGMIQTAVTQQNEALIERFERLISILVQFFPQILSGMQRQVVLDTGAVVGELAPAMDTELGRIIGYKERGN